MSRTGTVDVVAASWRMGDGKSIVDNSSSGGVVCGIDLVTGRILGPGRDLSGAVYTAHPSSGFVFEGAEVPRVMEIFEAAKKAHFAIRSKLSIGWDWAMTPEGPLVVEANSNWGGRGHSLVDERFQERAWELFLAADGDITGSGFPAGKRVRKNEMIRTTLVVRGKVQDAGYQDWIRQYAEERGVQADIKNLEDGALRCRLTGQRWRVEFVTLASHRGPASGLVERIDVQKVKRLG